MKRYWVEPSRTLLHNGKRYEGGQIVELDDAAARPLLELGAILEYDPRLPQNSEPELDSEAGNEDGDGDETEATLRRRGRPRR